MSLTRILPLLLAALLPVACAPATVTRVVDGETVDMVITDQVGVSPAPGAFGRVLSAK